MTQPHDSPPKSGHEALVRLREVIALGRPILGAGVRTGISAKFFGVISSSSVCDSLFCAENFRSLTGGEDNSGKYRMAG